MGRASVPHDAAGYDLGGEMIPIKEAKRIREELGLTHIVIFGVNAEGQQHVATHGETRQNAREAAKAGNKLKAALGWPEDLCKAQPLERICKNCAYYKPDYGMWCFNGWSGDGSRGDCLVEPKTQRVGAESGCRYFEPRS